MEKTACSISFMWTNGAVGEKSCDTHGVKWDTVDRPESCK